MRVLADTCISGRTVALLRSKGHDVEWAGDWEVDPGDGEILRRACDERRILMTLDKDFGELAIVRGEAHCGIVRIVHASVVRQGQLCVLVLERYGDELERGAIVTVEIGRIRVRRPAGDPDPG